MFCLFLAGDNYCSAVYRDVLFGFFQVITIVLQYIEMLRREGPKRWIYDEIKNIQDNDFRWIEAVSISVSRAFMVWENPWVNTTPVVSLYAMGGLELFVCMS